MHKIVSTLYYILHKIAMVSFCHIFVVCFELFPQLLYFPTCGSFALYIQRIHIFFMMKASKTHKQRVTEALHVFSLLFRQYKRILNRSYAMYYAFCRNKFCCHHATYYVLCRTIGWRMLRKKPLTFLALKIQ